MVCDTKKIKILFEFSYCYDEKKKKKKKHIVLNENNAKVMHDNTQLSYRRYTNKKYQFLN